MTGSDDHVPTLRTARELLRSASRYDLVLAVIPVAFLAAFAVAHVGAAPFRSALVVASLVGALALVDALFLNPPRISGRAGGA